MFTELDFVDTIRMFSNHSERGIMSKRVEIAILVVLSLVFGFAFLSICDQTVVPLLAKGSGPGGVTVAPSGWLQLIITGLGAGGFSLASVVVVLKNLASLIPASNPFHAVVAPAIDASQILLYQQAYKNAKSQAEKDQIRAAAKLADASLFDELFPV